MTCRRCGGSPAREVAFHKQTGAVFLRYYGTVAGPRCRACARRLFWSCTGHNLLLGWWGLGAFFFNWYYLYRNLREFLATRRD